MIISTSCSAQNANTLRQASNSYTISKTIKGGTVAVRDGSTLVIQKGGKVVNATITGRNIRIVTNGTDVAFENCNFTNATIVNSQLYATNFGLVPNMTSKPYNYTYKGKRINTTRNQGTDNTRAWQQLAQMLSNSSGVKITFNGSFYSGTATQFVFVRDANNLELSGGTMTMSLRLVNCNNVSIHDMKWVGFEGKHDFPPMYYKGDGLFNGVRHNSSNAHMLQTDKISSMGVADNGITIEIDNDNKRSENISVERCHFEMRQNGLCAGVRSNKRIVRNVKCVDCTASHIVYQPVVFHASNCLVNNMVADYCMQGVDISTCSNNITVINSRFTGCATGPKQENTEEFRSMSYNNVIEGCHFGINDDYILLDGSIYILNVSEGAKGDVFTVRNTTFDMKKNRSVALILNRTNKVVLDNVRINYDGKLHPSINQQWSAQDMFSIFGSTSHTPQYELNNVTINLATGTKIYSLCFPHVGGKDMNFKANNLTITGNGVVDNYFNTINNVHLTNCNLSIPSSTFARSVNSMDATSCNIASTKCLFVGDKSNATLKLRNNTISSEKVVDFKSTPKLVEMQGNNISLNGGEAFTGNANLSTKNFKVSGNNFVRKASSAKLVSPSSKTYKLLNNNSVK